MSKREEIIQLADSLIRQKGFNAFSFYEISDIVGIKTASIHYHFKTKSDLGVAVANKHIDNLQILIDRSKGDSPTQKLHNFFSIYENIKEENNVCLVGSLATDFRTLDEKIQERLKALSDMILSWVEEILLQGKAQKEFRYNGESRTKALMIVSNMLASVQLIRVTEQSDFEKIKQQIIIDLTEKIAS